MTNMVEISIEINNNIDFDEFRKAISFVSEDITAYSFKNGILSLELADEKDHSKIAEDIIGLASKYPAKTQEKKLLYNNIKKRDYHSDIMGNDLKGVFHMFYDGMIGMNEKAIFIYDYFDRVFENFALELNAKKKKYPVLLPVNSYLKTGYLNNSPQYSMFCCSACENLVILKNLQEVARSGDLKDVLAQPQFALSPSACFHTYVEYENRTLPCNDIFTFIQSVFRNEGRLNFSELGRLRDYHVREIVFIGDMDYVTTVRENIFKKTVSFLTSLDFCGNAAIATDPFVLPQMQKYKKVQLLEETKYEIKLNCEDAEGISVASFNLHGTAFTHPFKIRVEDCDETVTGCVGFGLERWVIAFFSQFGTNVEHWPTTIKEEYLNGKC